jgi:hypothetical protein
MNKIYSIFNMLVFRIIPPVVLSCLGISLLLPADMPYVGKIRAVLITNEISYRIRWVIGRLRSAPSDEKMIAHLNTHRAEFDSLAKAYYEDVVRKDAYEKNTPYLITKDKPFKANTDIEKQLRSLGLWELNPNMGPFIVSFGKDSPTFCTFGVKFRLVDHGPYPWWLFKDKFEKTYLYMPTIPPHPRWSNDPVRWLRYNNLEPSTDRPTRRIDEEQCAVRQVDRNWFIQNCGIEAYKLP